MLSKKSDAKSAKMRQKSLLIYLIVVVKLENQRQFDEIYEYCQLIFDEKLRLLMKLNLYCQTKVITGYERTAGTIKGPNTLPLV